MNLQGLGLLGATTGMVSLLCHLYVQSYLSSLNLPAELFYPGWYYLLSSIDMMTLFAGAILLVSGIAIAAIPSFFPMARNGPASP